MKRQNEYLLVRVRSASPLELVSMLYELAIQSVEEAMACLRSGDILKRGQAVNKAVETIFELQVSLRHDVQPEYSQKLAELYTYMQRRLGEAHAQKSEAIFQEITQLLRTLLEGWSGAVRNLASQSQETEVEPVAVTPSRGSFLGNPASDQAEERSWSL